MYVCVCECVLGIYIYLVVGVCLCKCAHTHTHTHTTIQNYLATLEFFISLMKYIEDHNVFFLIYCTSLSH